MFSLVSGVYESYFASPQVNILVVGAQGTGKTTMLERIKVTHFRKRPPPPTLQQTAMPDDLCRLVEGHSVDLPSSTTMARDQSQNRENSHPTISQNVAAEMGTPVRSRKRLTWVCPAPKRYSVQQMKDDDDDEEEVGEEAEAIVGLIEGAPALPNLNESRPPPPLTERTHHHTSVGSLDSVELASPPPPPGSANSRTGEDTENSSQTTGQHSQDHPTTTSPYEEHFEFDVQPNMKMISLAKIRPTIGMNLGKVNLCQAQCHVWDLGGRLADLWQRYYSDCDAVVFVWKLGKDVVPRDEEEDEDERPEITYELQQSLLNQVRSSIGDDIPFLVLGHAFGESHPCPVPTGTLYQTEKLLPHYHNPLQAFMVANAATGQGVQAAMEWLVPLAKRQLSIREKSMEKLP